MTLIAIHTTVATHDQAKALARELVSRRLVACAQVTPIESIYRWQGDVSEDNEYHLCLKTTRERYREVEAAIRALHTYDLPAIYAVPVTDAFPPYEDWVADAVSSPSNDTA